MRLTVRVRNRQSESSALAAVDSCEAAPRAVKSRHGDGELLPVALTCNANVLSDHFCVTLDDLAGSIRELRGAGVCFLHDEPMARGGARGIGQSIYAQDPDGYVVEIRITQAS